MNARAATVGYEFARSEMGGATPFDLKSLGRPAAGRVQYAGSGLHGAPRGTKPSKTARPTVPETRAPPVPQSPYSMA